MGRTDEYGCRSLIGKAEPWMDMRLPLLVIHGRGSLYKTPGDHLGVIKVLPYCHTKIGCCMPQIVGWYSLECLLTLTFGKKDLPIRTLANSGHRNRYHWNRYVPM